MRANPSNAPIVVIIAHKSFHYKHVPSATLFPSLAVYVVVTGVL